MDYVYQMDAYKIRHVDIREAAAGRPVYVLAERGDGDRRVTVYAVPTDDGDYVRAIGTNGPTIWESEDIARFRALLAEYGISD